MRQEELQPIEGRRLTIRGTVAKRGFHLGWANIVDPTIMLAPVATQDGRALAPHRRRDQTVRTGPGLPKVLHSQVRQARVGRGDYVVNDGAGLRPGKVGRPYSTGG